MQQSLKRMMAVGIGVMTLCVGLLFAAPATGQSLVSGTPGALVLQRILVTVNGDLITQTDLEQAQINWLRGRPVPPQTDEELARVIQEITPEVITNAVEQLLLVQRGREMGYSLSDEQFDEILVGIKEENDMDDEELVSALQRDEGMTLADLRGTMEEQMLVGQVQQVEVLGRINMTDTEAREYYDSNPDEFTEPSTVTLRELLVAVRSGGGTFNVARDNQARARAEGLLTRAQSGEDFTLLVEEFSDAASKANGGVIGPIEINDLSENVLEWIDGLESGDFSAVQRTPAGYQILKLEEFKAPAPAPFEEVREGIIDSVFNERRLEGLTEYLSDLREEAIIEWKDEGLNQIYDQYVEERASRSGA